MKDRIKADVLNIFGASGHGKVVADIAEKNGYKEIYFYDDNDSLSECLGYPVKGSIADGLLLRKGFFFVAIGDVLTRKRIQSVMPFERLVSLVHPAAIIGKDVQIGKGTVVMAGAVINSGATIGDGVIVNTCSSIDHDCYIHDYCHISIGSHIAGNVEIGAESFIGAGSIVINNVKICSGCILGAGAVVVGSIEEKGLYLGVPARKR